jgi:hypothetical protein
VDEFEHMLRTVCIPSVMIEPAYPIDPVTGIDANGVKWFRKRPSPE